MLDRIYLSNNNLFFRLIKLMQILTHVGAEFQVRDDVIPQTAVATERRTIKYMFIEFTIKSY